MREPVSSPIRPFRSTGVQYDRVSPADIDRILEAIGVQVAESAWRWADECVRSEKHMSQRTPQDWAAFHIDMAIETFRRSWHAIHSDTPVARHKWAIAVQKHAAKLLELLHAQPGPTPSESASLEPVIRVLTTPYGKPVFMRRPDVEDASPLIPLLAAMMPRHIRPPPYLVHPFEVLTDHLPVTVSPSGSRRVVTDEFPILADALRISIAGIQLLELRAQAVASTAEPEIGRRQETGRRAIVYFARQVGHMYRKLAGEVMPHETPPGHLKPRRSEVRFFQHIALLAAGILADDDRELINLLRSRGGDHVFQTASEDLREAWSTGGASPRKR